MANLNDYLALATWSTPRASDGEKGGPNQSFGAGGQPLPSQMHQATWPAPTAQPSNADGESFLIRKGRRPDGTVTDIGAMMLSQWVTPSARDWKDSGGMSATGTNPDGSTRSRLDQLPRQMAATDQPGPEQTGSSATTAKRGAPNPDFAFWLMGWPDEFRHGVLRAIASLPSSRRKSSAPSSMQRGAQHDRSP